jgi:hypothetical protein
MRRERESGRGKAEGIGIGIGRGICSARIVEVVVVWEIWRYDEIAGLSHECVVVFSCGREGIQEWWREVEWWKWRCRLLRWCWEEEEEEEWDLGMCWRARKSGKRE